MVHFAGAVMGLYCLAVTEEQLSQLEQSHETDSSSSLFLNSFCILPLQAFTI